MPVGDLPSRVALRRQIFVWGTLLVLVAFDFAGFYTNMQLVLADQPGPISVVAVLACGIVSIAFPWRFGAAIAARRSRAETSVLVMAVLTLVWLSLGIVMFWVRTHFVPTRGANGPTPGTDAGLAPSLDTAASTPLTAVTSADRASLMAIILGLFYLGTGVLSAEHAYWSERRTTLQTALRRRARLLRLHRGHQSLADEEDQRRALLNQHQTRLDEAHALTVAANAAKQRVVKEETVLEEARTLGDPTAVDRLLDMEERLRDGRAPHNTNLTPTSRPPEEYS